jgi:predicted RNA-binding protein with RPS1 domain
MHTSEVQGGVKLEEAIKVGEKHSFRVTKTNQEEHRIGLSLKPEGSSEERREPRQQQPKRESKPRSEAQASRKEEAAGPKAKSQLQLELEKHAARQQETSDQDGGE